MPVNPDLTLLRELHATRLRAARASVRRWTRYAEAALDPNRPGGRDVWEALIYAKLATLAAETVTLLEDQPPE